MTSTNDVCNKGTDYQDGTEIVHSPNINKVSSGLTLPNGNLSLKKVLIHDDSSLTL